MRTTLVNGLAGLTLVAGITIVSVACSNASNQTASAGAAAEAATAGDASLAPGGKATDSLAKIADASRIQGSPSAKLWVIEVSDFQCPYCKEWHDATYQMIVNDYVKTGRVRMAYVNFPLSIHAHAHDAAIAAMCAGAQDKFWPMHDSLFATQARWEREADPSATFASLAASIGVNASGYKACLSSPGISALVAGDQERARAGGVNATPSFWIGGGKLLEGAVPTADMKAAIDQALASSK
ncbi:MAG: DsbA family protein [Gemmatimonadota bacterium]|nr:DsbA family protein [Gemmatimonadota bacterium]